MYLYSEQTSSKLLKVLATAGRLPDDEVQQLASKGMTTASYLEDKINGGVLQEETLCAILAKGYSLRRIDLKKQDVDSKTLALFPQDLLQKNNVLPFQSEGKFVRVGIVDPVAMGLADTLRSICQLNAEFYLISPSNFNHIFNHAAAPVVIAAPSFGAVPLTSANKLGGPPAMPSPPTSSNIRPNLAPVSATVTTPSPAPAKQEVLADKQAVKNKKPLRNKWPVFDADLVVEFCDQILKQAISESCSDIHIECFRDMARVRLRFDGALQTIEMYSEYLFKNYQAVTARFKILAGCDISEKRMAQDGAITITDDRGKEVDFRFNLVPTKNGERIVMRILAGDPALSLDKIGFDPSDYQKVVEAVTAPQGMVLVTGPTGSGKTTTLYGALQYINSPDINILTAEDPIEYYLEGAGQVQANEKIGLGFSAILRAFLRQDPEVILVGEIRDQETIDIAVKAALTGHLLLSTLHTNDAVSSITRMLNMGVPNFMIASALSLIVAQRLARKNCSSCRISDTRITPEILERIGFSKEELAYVQPMKGRGCPSCNGSGLKGRRGIYEVLKKTKHIEEAILANAQGPQLLAAARLDGFKTMQEIGRELVRSGDISVEEFQRTLVMEG